MIKFNWLIIFFRDLVLSEIEICYKYKCPRNLFRYLPFPIFHPLQQQYPLHPLNFQPLAKSSFRAVSFFRENNFEPKEKIFV